MRFGISRATCEAVQIGWTGRRYVSDLYRGAEIGLHHQFETLSWLAFGGTTFKQFIIQLISNSQF